MTTSVSDDCTTQTYPPRKQDRIPSIELGRVLAIFLVVCSHANVFERLHVVGGEYGYIVDLPLHLLRWLPVPFFLLIAGYFFGRRVRAGRDPMVLLRQYAIPLSQVFGIWLLVYLVCPQNWVATIYEQGIVVALSEALATNLSTLLHDHVKLLLIPRPPIYHLWFLPVLLLGVAMVAGLLRLQMEQFITGLMIVLYGIELALEVASPNAFFAYEPRIWLRAVLFVFLGFWMSRYDRVPFPVVLALIVGGFVLAFSEGAVMKLFFHASSYAVRHHMYLGGVIMTSGFFLLALAKPNLGDGAVFPRLARLTFGVYLSHMLIEYALPPIHQQLPHLPLLWHFVYAVGVYVLALGLTVLLSRMPGARLAVLRG